MKFSALGDQAIIVTFGEEIGMDVYEKVQRLFQALQQHPFVGWLNVFRRLLHWPFIIICMKYGRK